MLFPYTAEQMIAKGKEHRGRVTNRRRLRDGWQVSEGMRDGTAGKFEISEFEKRKRDPVHG